MATEETSKTNFRPLKDFIVVVEFSEIVGPMVAITEPNEIPEELELDNFVLQVLAVDFRRKRQTGTAPQLNSPDMQTCFTEWRLNLHVFAYHLAVPDFAARGYTRAICLCYCSPTPGKIKKEFTKLTERFSRLSVLLKTAGQKTLCQDVTLCIQRLNDAKLNFESNEPDHEENQRALSNTFQIDLDQNILDNIISDMDAVMNLFSGPVVLTHKYNHSTDIKFKKPKFRPHDFLRVHPTLKSLIGDETNSILEAELKEIFATFSKNLIDLAFIRHQQEIETTFNIGGWKLNIDGIQKPKRRREVPSASSSVISNMANIESESMMLASDIDSPIITNTTTNNPEPPRLFPSPPRRNTLEEEDKVINPRQIVESIREQDIYWNKLRKESPNNHRPKRRSYGQPLDLGSLDTRFENSENKIVELNHVKKNVKIKNKTRERSTTISKRQSSRERYLTELLLKRCFDFSPSLIFSILVGRPLLVTSNKQKKLVQKTVTSLNLLVPGQDENSIVRWHEGKITLEICGKHRIIGLNSSWLSQSRDNIWDWVSVLDLDKNTFYGPEYIIEPEKKCMISNMISSRRCFLTQDSSCFLRHIRVCILQIVQVSWVHFWKHRMRLAKIPADYGKRDELHFSTLEMLSNLDEFCLCDREIIKYWTQLFQDEIYNKYNSRQTIDLQTLNDNTNERNSKLLSLIGKSSNLLKIQSHQRVNFNISTFTSEYHGSQ